MASAATALGDVTAIKVKLTGEAALDAMRVVAVRAARPDCWLGVDANQGYDPIDVPALAKLLATLDVALLEQPVARGREAELEGNDRPLPFADDESCRSAEHTSVLQSLM